VGQDEVVGEFCEVEIFDALGPDLVARGATVDRGSAGDGGFET